MCPLRKHFRVLSYNVWQEPGLVALNLILDGLWLGETPYLLFSSLLGISISLPLYLHPSLTFLLSACYSLPPILAALGFSCLPEPGCMEHSHSEKPMQLPVLFGGGS